MFSQLATAIWRTASSVAVRLRRRGRGAGPRASPQLRFLAALGGGRPNGLFFAGDLGQRIFQQPFSWKSLGVDIRGRSRTLRVNYRTSHQIRTQADRLLGPEVTDVDGNTEDRSGTISVFNGPPPAIRVSRDRGRRDRAPSAAGSPSVPRTGSLPHEIGVFVRSAGAAGPRPGRRRAGRPALQDPRRARRDQPAATSRSAPCTWPRAWSSAPWP